MSDPPEKTDVDVANGEGGQQDADSGVGTMSDVTGTLSNRSTPSQSELNTPVMSPTGAEESFQFPEIPIGTATMEQEINSRFPGSNTSHQADDTSHAVSSAQRSALTREAADTSRAVSDGSDSVPTRQEHERRDDGVFTRPRPPSQRSTDSSPFSTSATSASCPKMDSRGFFVQESGPQQKEKVDVCVRYYNGQLRTFTISLDASVDELRRRIHADMGVPPSQQRLVYSGKEMVAGTLRDYRVHRFSEISLLGRLRGGC